MLDLSINCYIHRPYLEHLFFTHGGVYGLAFLNNQKSATQRSSSSISSLQHSSLKNPILKVTWATKELPKQGLYTWFCIWHLYKFNPSEQRGWRKRAKQTRIKWSTYESSPPHILAVWQTFPPAAFLMLVFTCTKSKQLMLKLHLFHVLCSCDVLTTNSFYLSVTEL